MTTDTNIRTKTTTNIGMVNGFNPADVGSLAPELRDKVERRAKLLGPAYRLFYRNPVEICRGEGVILYDPAGNDYLDAYNNVVAVGHCHPRVVEAISAQLKVLCTHTRYVQEGILTYAEQILPTFEGNIEHIMFTCTGSEANDLAMRIAQHKTGRRGIIITSEAYHGNSWLTAGFSPSLGKMSPLGTWVRRIPAPDSYRMDHDTLGQWMAEQVRKQIVELERQGEGLAAFIADSLFSSDGIYAHPISLLAPVAKVVQDAGGLFIADEVQSGFGRSGEHLWGYQRHDFEPDIVTLGKPMGNGYPIAAVAVSADVIRSFGNDLRYFNTFGGNSVAIAAAQATFDVIRDERLMENANSVGKMIRDGLTDIASRHERIGDVRGAGLYIGVELVKCRDTKEPDSATAFGIVNGLRERRVLISATGYDSNILKIRPPLIFQENHADRLLTELEATIREL